MIVRAKYGQTLENIAQQYYGSTTHVGKLVQDNDHVNASGFLNTGVDIYVDDNYGNRLTKDYFNGISNDKFENCAFNNDVGFDTKYRIDIMTPTFSHNIYLLDGTTDTSKNAAASYVLDYGADGIKGINLFKSFGNVQVRNGIIDLSNQPNLRVVNLVMTLERLVLPTINGININYLTNDSIDFTLASTGLHTVNVDSVSGHFVDFNLDLQNCKLTSGMMNGILRHIDMYITASGLKTINLSSQATGQTIDTYSGNVNGVFHLANLINKEWDVTI